MDQDIRALRYALAYNSIIFIASALLWIWVVRRIRKDTFRPNAKKRQKTLQGGLPSPAHRASTLTADSSVFMQYELQSKYFGCIPRDHWIVLLLKWDIARFSSTDVYLYLLFLKGAAILFLIISIISMGIVFPVFWTARSTSTHSSANERALDFFERAVITNMRGDDIWRIWLIYTICWVVTVVGLYASFRLYQNVRSDEFRAALFTSKRRPRDLACAPARFMPNKYSVTLKGLDRTLLDASVVRRKLLRFFEEDEILAVHIVMDFSEALAAHRVFQDCLSRLLDAQRREELRRAAEHEAESPQMAPVEDSSYWAITLPSADEPVPSPSTTRNKPSMERNIQEPPIDAMSLPRTSATETSKKALSSTASDSHRQATSALYHDMHRLATSPKSSSLFLSTASRYAELARPLLTSDSFQPQRPGNRRCPAAISISDRGDAEEEEEDEEYSSAASSGGPPDPASVTSSPNVSPGTERHQHPAWWPSRAHASSAGGDADLDLPVCRRLHPDTGSSSAGRRSPSRVSCLKSAFYRKDEKTRVQERISHYEAKVLSQFSILNRIRSQPPTRNVGMAFVSFRHAEAARFAIFHDFGDPGCPMFRSRADDTTSVNPECGVCGKYITHHDCGCTKWNPHWRIREAPPPGDIIWENIHVSSWVRWFRRVSANLLIFLLSLLLTSSALVADALNPFAQHVEHIIEKVSFFRMSISGWVAPLILYLINALLLPFLVAWAADVSKFWRNSNRDRAVLHGNINFMVLNSLVFPVIGTTSIQGAFLFLFHNSDVANLFTLLGQMVAGASGSFMTRYVLNAVFINSAMQLLQLPMFSQQRVMLKLGKKPKKWAFDFGYWYAFHLSILALCLIFSVDLPMIPPLGCLFFSAKFLVDKYNFSFAVWKVTAESAGAVASTVCSFMFSFQSLFLFIMAGYFVAIGLHAATLFGSTANTMLKLPRIANNTTFTSPPNTVTVPMGTDPLEWHNSTVASALASDQGGSIISELRNLQSISLPTQGRAKAIVVGGLAMLSLSLLMFLVTFGERAQRTIVDRHAGRLRRLGRSCHVWVARKLADWDIVVPSRKVMQTAASGAELTETQIEELRKAYAHPYEKEDAELGSYADQ